MPLPVRHVADAGLLRLVQMLQQQDAGVRLGRRLAGQLTVLARGVREQEDPEAGPEQQRRAHRQRGEQQAPAQGSCEAGAPDWRVRAPLLQHRSRSTGLSMTEVTGGQGSTLAFTGAVLERAANDRGDAAWLERQRTRAGRPLARALRARALGRGRPPAAGGAGPGLRLPRPGRRPSPVRDRRASPTAGHPAGLREAATELPADEAALAAYAASLLVLAPPPPLLRQLRRRRPRRPTAATSAAAPPATPTTSRAPTRS